jgi:1-acyl-sn-glycerol-3-phosphate acyltransferase
LSLDWNALWYKSCYHLCGAALSLGCSFRTEGMHHVPATGPVLLIANHQSVIDPVLVGLAVRRPMISLARKTLFRHRLLALVMSSFHAVPVDQEGFAREGLQTLIDLLRAERVVLLFPEGERTFTGEMQPLRPGVHLVVKKAPAPIVPVGIAGAFDAWPRSQPLPFLSPLFWPAGKASMAVSLGKPIDGRRVAQLPRAEVLDQLFRALKEQQARAERLRRRP